MDSFCIEKQSRDFEYESHSQSPPLSVKEKISIPLDSNVTVRELSYRIINKHQLPDNEFPKIYQKLNELIQNYVDDYEANFCENVITNRSVLVPHIQKILNDSSSGDSNSIDTKSTTSKESSTNDDNFYRMYHEIAHSGKLTTQLIQLELHNSEVIKVLLGDKDECLKGVKQEQIDNIKSLIYSENCEDRIQQLTKSQKDLLAEEEAWSSKIDSVRRDQKREFRAWIKNTHEDYIQHRNASSNNTSNSSDMPNTSAIDDFVEFMPDDEIHFEESYTINLGAQLKTTHNLRLISVDILKFCSTLCTPQRIQTAMSLYSNSLSAIVLLVDKDVLSRKGIREGFHELCMSSSENHFSELQSQLEEINSAALEKRGIKTVNGSAQLNTGDVYVTRHSNLSEAHMVFHLVIDDTLKHQEINSRHPVILGIRNILKMAYLYDIANISIPLLLLHDLVEDCTIQWCMKRAELVLKCVKGFMIEMSSLLSLAENENKTVQFVVPREISQDLFNSLSSIFPNVFRLSNTLVLTTNS